MVQELTIISGKGGTGKTSLTASFAVLAKNAVLADCDVDASDLHLTLKPHIQKRRIFKSGRLAKIVAEDCIGCGACVDLCRFDAIRRIDESGEPLFQVDPIACEGCGVCVHFCPPKAITFEENECGELFVSDTRCGPMAHARLGIAADNSGKLVSQVRQEAKALAEEHKASLILVDGPPGIGCPVIASITGATLVLVVTEPTLSGSHDLERVLQLARHFGIPSLVCLNKWDINPSMTETIEARARTLGARVMGRIRYDRAFTEAQLCQKALVEYQANGCAGDVRAIWTAVEVELNQQETKTNG